MKFNTIKFLSSAAMVTSTIFIPNLAQDLGANKIEIGFLTAAFNVSMFISSYIFGRASDLYGHKFFVRIGLGISAITLLLQVMTDPNFAIPALADLRLLVAALCLTGFSFGIFPAALTAYVYEAKGPMGEFTSFGSLGWAVGTLVAGLIYVYWGVFLWCSACMMVAFAVSLTLKDMEFSHRRVPLFPKKIIQKNWRVYFPFLLRHWGANSIWVIYQLYIISLGGDRFWIGVIYSVNAFTQFMVMRSIDRFKGKSLITAGIMLSAVTFSLLPLAQHYLQLVPIQVILASSFSCLYVGSLVYLMQANEEKATVAGILGSMENLSKVLGSVSGGALSQLFNFRATMYFATGLTIFGFGLFKMPSRTGKKRDA
jgi:MFS family permease